MRYLTVCFLGLITILSVGGAVYASNLTEEQNLWLNKRNRTVIVRPERNKPPFIFSTSGKTGKPSGLGIDYLELVAKKESLKLAYTEPASLASILDAIKEGKEGIVVSVTPTPSREAFMYFTDPFITIPAVIITRKDYESRKTNLTLADFSGKRVAMGEAYAIEEYVKANYKKIIIEPVVDDEVGIQKVLLGEADAALIDLASLSYYTANKALSYVVVAGQTGFEYEFAFGIPSTTPELQQILNTALSEISPQEQAVIKEKWITAATETRDTSTYQFFGNNILLIVASIIAGAILFLISIIIIVRSFRRAEMRFSPLAYIKKKTKKEEVAALKDELETLEEASEEVKEELQHIKKLERDIAEKIKEIE